MELKTLTLNELTQQLRDLGLSIGNRKVKACIEQGIFDFAYCVKMETNEYLIFQKGFDEWVKAHSVEKR